MWQRNACFVSYLRPRFISFYLGNWTICRTCTFAPERHTCPTSYVDWLTSEQSYLAVASFLERGAVSEFGREAESLRCLLAESLRCLLSHCVVACMICISVAYFISEVGVLKRVDSTSESPGSVRQFSESKFERNTNSFIVIHATTTTKVTDTFN